MIKKCVFSLLCVSLLFSASTCFAKVFSNGTEYKACFTPGENCEQVLINEVETANSEILVQAYSFTSRSILRALLRAQRRGVLVVVLIDASQPKTSGSVYKSLLRGNVIVKVDDKPAIAHNKVMIIDEKEVVTGSYNFTNSANKRNAENLLIIKNKDLAKEYKVNWQRRDRESK